MDSINSLLGGAKVNYSDLAKVANGTYNKGEIVFKKGFFGGFGKVNNHVGALSGHNTVVTTAEQNRLTNAAVFKAILNEFGGQSAAERAEKEVILGMNDFIDNRADIERRLDSFENPYIKEAFIFLMCGDGAPLSRDEMRYLDTALKNGGANEVNDFKANLADLHAVKLGTAKGAQQENGRARVRGLTVVMTRNAEAGHRSDKDVALSDRLEETTVNMLAHRPNNNFNNVEDNVNPGGIERENIANNKQRATELLKKCPGAKKAQKNAVINIDYVKLADSMKMSREVALSLDLDDIDITEQLKELCVTFSDGTMKYVFHVEENGDWRFFGFGKK